MSNVINANFSFISFIDHLKDMVICLTLDKKIIVVNSVAENFLGDTKTQLMNKDFHSLSHLLQLDILNTTSLDKLLSRLPITNLEYACKAHDAVNYNISWSFFPLLDTTQTVIEGLILLGKNM